MKVLKRIISLFLSCAIAVTMMCGVLTINASAEVSAPQTELQRKMYDIIKNHSEYKEGLTWGNNDCYSYALRVFRLLFNYDSKTDYYAYAPTSLWNECVINSNMLESNNSENAYDESGKYGFSTDYVKVLSQARTGDIIQGYKRYEIGHTMLVYKVDVQNQMFEYLDCNGDDKNSIKTHKISFSEFVYSSDWNRYPTFKIYRAKNYNGLYPNEYSLNLGDTFYAYIINTISWKHLTNDLYNVSMRTLTGEANQVWKFERQSDYSYKISNCLDGYVLDDNNSGQSNGTNIAVASSNNSNAQRWYITGESGAYFLRSKCGNAVMNATGSSSGIDGTNINLWEYNGTVDQKFQIWKLDGVTTPHIYCLPGTQNSPTKLYWTKSENATKYNIKIWNGQYWVGDPYKVITDITDLEYSLILPPGYYEAYVDAVNNYSFQMSENVVQFTITENTVMPMSKCTISAIPDQTYTGNTLTPKPTVTYKIGLVTFTLKEGTDYDLLYQNNISAGTGWCIVKGKGNYKDAVTVGFNIVPVSLFNINIEYFCENGSSTLISTEGTYLEKKEYTGSALKSGIIVKHNGTALKEGTDYSVEYQNNVNVGKANVIVTGKGNYTGERKFCFNITSRSASNFTIQTIAPQTYTGTALTPAVTVKDGSKTLTNGTDYTVTYSNNISAGTAAVTVTGKGNYTGTKTTTFKIEKPANSIIYGDVNGDGDVTMADLLLMKQVMVKVPGKTMDMAAADVNGDGEATMADLLRLKQYMVKVPGITLGK